MIRKNIHFMLAAVCVTLSQGTYATADRDAKPVYMIAELTLKNPEVIGPYREQVEATMKSYGGRFLVRGGKIVNIEGTASKGHIVISRFDSLAKAEAWYHSPAYQKILPYRHKAGETRLYFVEGLTLE
ncbi:TPA: DUF1330 domain-containing protein [Klebsiella quasipneumoniae subsp. similipneumoniae]|nr:DUF1330 domain-containing protein [Klebsiella quasipneumoniae subsp. similipneumoniae]